MNCSIFDDHGLAITGFIIGLVSLSLAVLGFRPSILRKRHARKKIANFIGQAIDGLKKDIRLLREMIIQLSREEVESTGGKLHLKTLVHDFDLLPFDDVQPLFRNSRNDDDAYAKLRSAFKQLQATNNNLEQSSSIFERQLSVSQHDVRTFVADLIALMDVTLSLAKSGQVAKEDVPFIQEFDKIMAAWQLLGKKTNSKVIGGDALEPYELKKKLFEPLMELGRSKESVLSARIMDVSRKFLAELFILKSEQSNHVDDLKIYLSEIEKALSEIEN